MVGAFLLLFAEAIRPLQVCHVAHVGTAGGGGGTHEETALPPPPAKARARDGKMPSADELKAKLLASALAPSVVEIVDTSDGCGSKFEAIIVSASFDGMALLDRQRVVNEVIGQDMESIHAFSMKTWTPAQHEKKKNAT